MRRPFLASVSLPLAGRAASVLVLSSSRAPGRNNYNFVRGGPRREGGGGGPPPPAPRRGARRRVLLGGGGGGGGVVGAPPSLASAFRSRGPDAPAAEASADADRDDDFDDADDDGGDSLRLRPASYAGLTEAEAASVLGAASSACDELGVPFLPPRGAEGAGSERRRRGAAASSAFPGREGAAAPASAPGAAGRVALLVFGGGRGGCGYEEEEERLLSIKHSISERLDGMGLDQPVLVALRPEEDGGAEERRATTTTPEELSAIVEDEVERYSLREPIASDDEGRGGEQADDSSPSSRCWIPSLVVEIDGVMVEDADGSGGSRWDASSVVVFDDLIDDDLRGRLLDVVLGRDGSSSGGDDDGDDDFWDDVKDGPDPRRWERGGLLDIPDGSDEMDHELLLDDDGPCWGLTHDAVMDLCYRPHPAISEFEAKLTRLFPDFVVSRLPEAVLGESVSPLTANAPTYGDTFDFHIDADPNLAPPSPWTDVYGRYPNRSPGKPRFVSCLLYLNEEWDGEGWGAPTRFLDPPTGETYDVAPEPGRCVVMDQDVSHAVAAPNEAAGRRPRYSLVWKLVLHPREAGGDVSDLAGGRRWPEPILVGSAAASLADET